MESSALQLHLNHQKINGTEKLVVVIFKPDYLENEVIEFQKYCVKTGLSIIKSKRIVFRREIAIALYPKIFSFSKEDLNFGIKWKQKTIDYLISNPSLCFLIRGKFADLKLFEYKHELRKRYGKITHPRRKLSEKKFFENVIKNLIHVVDQEELQNCIWLIFSN